MTRKIVDCREMPSDIGCTLTLTGEQAEVVQTAAQRGVAMRGHTDGDELRDAIRSSLHDDPQATGPSGSPQLSAATPVVVLLDLPAGETLAEERARYRADQQHLQQRLDKIGDSARETAEAASRDADTGTSGSGGWPR